MSVRAPLAAAAAIAVGATALRVVDPRGGLPGLTPEALPLLVIAALLCSAALLQRTFPPGAWVATALAAGLGTVETIGSVRAWDRIPQPEGWPWLVALAEVAIVASASIAAAYGLGPRPASSKQAARTLRLVVAAAVVTIAFVGGSTVVATFAGWLPIPTVASGESELSPLRLSGRLAAGFVVVAMIVGVWRDLAGPIRRARSSARGTRDLPRALIDELFPAASALRRRGREEERARLAADLHALVLPDLRRASSAAEASGAAGEPLAAELRHALLGVERLMHERESVVFEQFGLVAALEWLAERTQEQSQLDVVVELDGAEDDPEALPLPVRRAAFRVAMLAVDNAVRHAAASRVDLRLEARGGAMRLAIVDDGRGMEQGAAAHRGRGLGDMRLAAAEVDASVAIRSQDRGTTVEFRWVPAGQAAAQPAMLTKGSADIPNAPHR